MIIKSKVVSFGFWLSIFMLIFSVSMIIVPILDLTFKLNLSGFRIMPLAGKIFSSLTMLIGTGVSGKILWDSNILEIDNQQKTLKFTNRFTWVKTTYNFNYFDASMIIYEAIRGGYARNYYLIKDKKAVKRIIGLIYSNQGELEEALKEIPSLGVKKYSHLNSAKILFGYPII